MTKKLFALLTSVLLLAGALSAQEQCRTANAADTAVALLKISASGQVGTAEFIGYDYTIPEKPVDEYRVGATKIQPWLIYLPICEGNLLLRSEQIVYGQDAAIRTIAARLYQLRASNTLSDSNTVARQALSVRQSGQIYRIGINFVRG